MDASEILGIIIGACCTVALLFIIIWGFIELSNEDKEKRRKEALEKDKFKKRFAELDSMVCSMYVDYLNRKFTYHDDD